MPLANLREVTLHCTSAQRAAHADRTSLPYIQNIVRISSVETVVLDGCYPSVPVLNEYFHATSRSITTLKGINTTSFIELTGDADPPSDENTPPKRPFFALAATTSFGPRLSNPNCPFALSRLVMLVLMEAYYPRLAPLLPHLETAHVDVGLRPLHSLRKFKTAVSGGLRCSLTALLAALTRLPPANRVARVTSLGFDAELVALSKRSLPALERVNVGVPLGNGVSEAEFISWFPEIEAQGWLNVFER
ncbi:hypothetical protein FB451DRAFT_1565599 [Mycena latifolia]|nr:hypothetical protein FB451DRAFT_1565599 [Mycena latifolia]